MNFFEHQDHARRLTRRLVLLFVAAVLTLIGLTALLLGLVTAGVSEQESWRFDPVLLLWTVLVVGSVVGLGTLFRLLQLRAGGRVVAESLGGRLLNPASQDAAERRALNVVEEMAIAAGLPVPPVYILDDPAINAFAAGYHAKDAVIGLTRGCIETLDREELQGVVAHEFSHIFNGDMRLNIRLMGLLYGIMVIGMIGYHLMLSARFGGRSRNNHGAALALFGVGLAVIGYGGTFFGNLIKAAVSRQREFLADASAVQFTRNPDGIAGALKKIAGHSAGSRLSRVEASEVSHMLFGQGLKSGFTGLFATHPPLNDRIRRLDPSWQPKRGNNSKAALKPEVNPASAQTSGLSAGADGAGRLGGGEHVGNPGPEHLRQAQALLARISPSLREASHELEGAHALVFCLLLSVAEAEAGRRQRQWLMSNLSIQHWHSVEQRLPQVEGLPREACLPLLELCMPTLQQLSSDQARQLLSDLAQVMQVDEQIHLFEWALFMIVRSALQEGTVSRAPDKPLEDMAQACQRLLSALALAGHQQLSGARAAMSAAVAELPFAELSLLAGADQDIAALNRAVNTLRQVRILQRPRLLKAMAAAIMADGKVTVQERELYRALGALLDCPMPPLPAVQGLEA